MTSGMLCLMYIFQFYFKNVSSVTNAVVGFTWFDVGVIYFDYSTRYNYLTMKKIPRLGSTHEFHKQHGRR